MPMKPGPTVLALLAVICLHAGGCTTATLSKPAAGLGVHPNGQWLRTELYLAAVEVDRWREFLANNVTPKFPAGFTVLDAYGQWRSPRGEIHAIPSRVLIVLHPATPQADAALEAIRQEFKIQFNQVSVLRATAPARVAF